MRTFSRRSPPESSLKVKPEGILQYSIKWFRHIVKERKKKSSFLTSSRFTESSFHTTHQHASSRSQCKWVNRNWAKILWAHSLAILQYLSQLLKCLVNIYVSETVKQKGLRVGKSLETFEKKQSHSGFGEITSVLEHLRFLSQNPLRDYW